MGLPFEIESRRGPIEALLGRLGAWLVDIDWKRLGGRQVISILADKEGGITLDECAQLNHEIGAYLDGENLMLSSYFLEVSSPGLDRPMRSEKDFVRAVGKKVKVVVRNEGNKIYTYFGRLLRAENDILELEMTKDKSRMFIPTQTVLKATQEVEFR